MTVSAELIDLASILRQLNDSIQQPFQQLDERDKQRRELEEVVLDVGGMRFEVPKSTLVSHPNTFFAALLSERWRPNDGGLYVIDRNPKHFGRILEYLRTGKLQIADLCQKQVDQYANLFTLFEKIFIEI